MARKRACKLIVAAALALIAVALWRWVPRPTPPVSPQMRQSVRLLASGPAAPAAPPKPPANPSTRRERLVAAAFALVGKPYVWGAKGPRAYDCSGLTKAVYARAGVKLPDGSFNQAEGEKALTAVGALRPGDLVFYRWPGSDRVTHVTVYVGDGWLVGAGSAVDPKKSALYPLSVDLVDDGRVLTYRHIELPDGS